METDQNSHSLPRKFPPSNCGAKVPIPPCGLGDAPHSCSNPMSLVFGGWGNWVEELWFNVALESRTAWMQWCWEHPPLCEQPCPNLPKKQIDKNSGPGTGEILCRWPCRSRVAATVTAAAHLSWQTLPGEQALWDSQILLFEVWASWGCIRHALC